MNRGLSGAHVIRGKKMSLDFWGLLMEAVRSGEMDMEEAHSRDNYHRFVSRCPGIVDPDGYVMDTPYDELPPFIFVLGDDFTDSIWVQYTEEVERGDMTAYEAAETYYEAVRE